MAGLVATDAVRKRRAPPREGYPQVAHETVEVAGDPGQAPTALRLYTAGADVYEAMFDAVESAERRILLESFIWKGDDIGRAFVAALARKARDGVAVHVIYDRFANLVVSPSFKHFPPEIHTLAFRPDRGRLPVDLRSVLRDHRKILAVDERVAFVGGYNLGALYATGRWRDTHVRVEGPAAGDLADAFADLWNANRPPGLPLVPEVARGRFDPHVAVRRNDPDLRIFPVRGMYLEAFDRAAKRIWLTHAYFVPDRAMRRGLCAAATRGVDVRVLLPAHSNHVLADWLARRHFGELLAAGVRFFAYRDIMIHAKTCTIDGAWSTVGTANIDRLSMLGNYEINLEVHDAAFARQLEAVFCADAGNADEVTAEGWARRPAGARLIEGALTGLSPLV